MKITNVLAHLDMDDLCVSAYVDGTLMDAEYGTLYNSPNSGKCWSSNNPDVSDEFFSWLWENMDRLRREVLEDCGADMHAEAGLEERLDQMRFLAMQH